MKNPIDNVTIDRLDVCLRMCGVQLDRQIIDKVIDLVELIEEKGEKTSIDDISYLQNKWKLLNNKV